MNGYIEERGRNKPGKDRDDGLVVVWFRPYGCSAQKKCIEHTTLEEPLPDTDHGSKAHRSPSFPATNGPHSSPESHVRCPPRKPIIIVRQSWFPHRTTGNVLTGRWTLMI